MRRHLQLWLCLIIAAVYSLQAQGTISIIDTTLPRGTTFELPLVLELSTQPGDSLTMTIRYSRASLHIHMVVAKSPASVEAELLADDAFPPDQGQATIRVRTQSSLNRVELALIGTVLWSGNSPAQVTAISLERNRQPISIQSTEASITLSPQTPLTVELTSALGPIAPQPLYGDNLRITYWLETESSASLALFDPLGREYGRWSFPNQAAGPHTVELPIERSTTGAAMYHVRLEVNGRTFIAPCIIAK